MNDYVLEGTCYVSVVTVFPGSESACVLSKDPLSLEPPLDNPGYTLNKCISQKGNWITEAYLRSVCCDAG